MTSGRHLSTHIPLKHSSLTVIPYTVDEQIRLTSSWNCKNIPLVYFVVSIPTVADFSSLESWMGKDICKDMTRICTPQVFWIIHVVSSKLLCEFLCTMGLWCPWKLVTLVSKLGDFTYLRENIQPTFIVYRGELIHWQQDIPVIIAPSQGTTRWTPKNDGTWIPGISGFNDQGVLLYKKVTYTHLRGFFIHTFLFPC